MLTQDTVELSEEVRAMLKAESLQSQSEADFTPILDDEEEFSRLSFDALVMKWTGCSPEGFAISLVLGIMIGLSGTWLAFALGNPK